jgi:hypothetical protein
MKNICIDKIQKPDKSSYFVKDKLYKVYLGNGYVFESKSLAAAKAFINQTNKMLNMQLHQMNAIIASLQAEYRCVWFYLDGKLNLENRINEAFRNADSKINMAIDRCSFENGNHYVFKHLEFAIHELNTIAKIIAKIQYKKSNMPDYYRLTIIVNETQSLIEQLNEYPISLKEKTDQQQQPLKQKG